MNKYAEYVKNTLPARDLLEQLAEECNELSKASLKLIRAIGDSENPTPIGQVEAYDNFIEEQKDVISVLWLLTNSDRYAYIDNYPKMERCAKRLGYKECEGEENPPADKIDKPRKHLPRENLNSKTMINDVTTDDVNHPAHYTGGKIEVIDFIEDKELGFHLGNAVKYISRAGRKNPDKTIEDLKKAVWYINRQIESGAWGK